MCMATDDPLATYVRARPRDRDFSSRRAAQSIKSWLQTCDAHGCAPVSTFKPTRLIEVHPASAPRTDIVRLRDGASCCGSYATLSYCWGGPQGAATTSHNAQAHYHSILVSGLPQTIQDAITLTRKLGILFLWVDSMCIIQDSVEDKAVEIGRMGEIYMNSYLTLSATRALTAKDGFLAPRPYSFAQDISAYTSWDPTFREILRKLGGRPRDIAGSLPVILPDGRVGRANIRQRIHYVQALEPISHRAWTLQERILSPRVLSFGQCLTWSCARGRLLDECTGDLCSWTAGDQLRLSIDRDGTSQSTTLGHDTSWAANNDDDGVGAMSATLDLASTDKLPAVAGLAQCLHILRSDDSYMAGSWRSTLAQDLMWCAPQSGTRSAQWRAPSWSWASFDGSIHFMNNEDLLSGTHTLFQDVSYTAQYQDPQSPFGELLSASLSLTARLGKATRILLAWAHDRSSSLPDTAEVLWDIAHVTLMTASDLYRLRIDDKRDSLARSTGSLAPELVQSRSHTVLSTDTVWCLAVRGKIDFDVNAAWDDETCDTRLDGLVLKQNDDGTFRRIGVFKVHKWDVADYIAWDGPWSVTMV